MGISVVAAVPDAQRPLLPLLDDLTDGRDRFTMSAYLQGMMAVLQSGRGKPVSTHQITCEE